MRTLAFDGRMGASGDMILAALLAAGADRDALVPVEEAETLDVAYEVRTVEKNGISATAVDVVLTDEDGHGHDHAHPEDHAHGGDDHSHDHDHDHTHAEGHGPSRTYDEVREVVASMDLPTTVADEATAIFELLGEAEAAVHGTDIAETHFHEVGADDAIADVVGACLLLADLDPDRVVTTPLSTGGGSVEMSHGTYPVPTPAVVEVAERADWSLRGGPVDRELLTPTGAAILAHVADGVETLPAMRVHSSGYGAGGYDFPEHPNVLRAIVGDGSGGLRRDEITVLETNLDDASPEVLGGLQETLLDAGARDVSIVPLTMKKSRPGHLVKVIVKPEDTERVARRLAEETGTLGIREHGAGHRWIADREVVTATILEAGERHEVRVKIASDASGDVYDLSAEYDDAAAVATETDLPIREVTRRAEAAVRQGRADRLVHAVDGAEWGGFDDADEYAPASLDEEGFVHLSTPVQIVAVAQTLHLDDEEPKLLVVDPEKLDAELKYEEQPGGGYAHAYGPVNAGAVVDVLDLPREDGRFQLPDELQ